MFLEAREFARLNSFDTIWSCPPRIRGFYHRTFKCIYSNPNHDWSKRTPRSNPNFPNMGSFVLLLPLWYSISLLDLFVRSERKNFGHSDFVAAADLARFHLDSTCICQFDFRVHEGGRRKHYDFSPTRDRSHLYLCGWTFYRNNNCI